VFLPPHGQVKVAPGKMGTYVTPAKQMQNWCQPAKPVDWDANHEPSASDHGDVLYTIKKDPVVGRNRFYETPFRPKTFYKIILSLNIFFQNTDKKL
jgi:hypothetical protein